MSHYIELQHMRIKHIGHWNSSSLTCLREELAQVKLESFESSQGSSAWKCKGNIFPVFFCRRAVSSQVDPAGRLQHRVRIRLLPSHLKMRPISFHYSRGWWGSCSQRREKRFRFTCTNTHVCTHGRSVLF